MKCPTCGAENEAGNRFCEQCGSRIEPSGAVPQAQVDLASAPTAAGPTCPNCGAAVLPGEAFCENCGAALAATAPAVVANEAPTMIAPSALVSVAIVSSSGLNGLPSVTNPADGDHRNAVRVQPNRGSQSWTAMPASIGAPLESLPPAVKKVVHGVCVPGARTEPMRTISPVAIGE